MKRKAVVVAAIAGLGVAAFGMAALTSPQPVRMPRSVPAFNPAVSQATIGATVCVPGWTATIRPPESTTAAIKARLERGRNIRAELDHGVPLELGGWPGADGRNLWLEPQPRASVVDGTENALKISVCRGQITLKSAQRQIVLLKETHG